MPNERAQTAKCPSCGAEVTMLSSDVVACLEGKNTLFDDEYWQGIVLDAEHDAQLGNY